MLDWAELLKRASAVDDLSCARCAGTMKILTFIHSVHDAREILDHLGARPPRRRSSRLARSG